MLILNNIDDLFEKPHYSAAVGGQCAHPEWFNLSSGLMVIEPSEQFFNNLMSNIEPAMIRRFNEGLNVGDQDVFQETFPEWKKHEELLLPETYNCFYKYIYDLCRVKNYKFKDINVVHFVGENKPWSNGCFTKNNILKLLSMLKHGRFRKFSVYFKYIYFAR